MVNKQLWGLWALVGTCVGWSAMGLLGVESMAFAGEAVVEESFVRAAPSSVFRGPDLYAQRGNFSVVRDANQVPTARYGRGEAVDLSLIIDEWRDRYPSIPVFACTCNADTCGDRSLWPFREYTRYQPFVALGDFNATNSESTGFNCFDIDSGARPQS